MNTRLQVEHPVTEMVTGVDLVQWQIRIARGERLDLDPSRALTPRGHAIECRIYAEDPDQKFLPSPGLIRALRPAAGPGIRDDGGVTAGYTVPVYYDSMIAKLVAHADDRDQAIARMSRALSEYQVLGIRTTIPFFVWLMRQPDYRAARYDTTWLDGVLAARRGHSFNELEPGDELLVTLAAAVDTYLRASADAGRAAGRSPLGHWERAARTEALRP
jgi:acetyl-CoA carboxylase biotin carboxylase subunit